MEKELTDFHSTSGYPSFSAVVTLNTPSHGILESPATFQPPQGALHFPDL